MRSTSQGTNLFRVPLSSAPTTTTPKDHGEVNAGHWADFGGLVRGGPLCPERRMPERVQDRVRMGDARVETRDR